MQAENLYADWTPFAGPERELEAVAGGLLEPPHPATASAVIAAAGAMIEMRDLCMPHVVRNHWCQSGHAACDTVVT
jgi:hypothetical protein